MKFKDFQASVMFSSTFKAFNLREKNSCTFKDFQLFSTMCGNPELGMYWIQIFEILPE